VSCLLAIPFFLLYIVDRVGKIGRKNHHGGLSMRLSALIAVSLLSVTILTAAAPVQAAPPLFNEWQEFAFPVPDTFDCAGEDGVASGVVHRVAIDLNQGGVGFHLNAQGIWKGNDTGTEYKWRDNITDVIPIDNPDNFVGTLSESLKIIGGPNGSFRLKGDVHVTVVNNEVVVYFDNVSTSCSV
jgi:hypothetical protein